MRTTPGSPVSRSGFSFDAEHTDSKNQKHPLQEPLEVRYLRQDPHAISFALTPALLRPRQKLVPAAALQDMNYNTS